MYYIYVWRGLLFITLWWAVQSLNVVIYNSSHALFIIRFHPGNCEGKKNLFIMEEKTFLTEKEKNDLACQIENYVSKYWRECVKSLKYEWVIDNIYDVKVSNESIKETVKNFWTFEATSNILTTDQATSVKVEKKRMFVGNVVFTFRKNSNIDNTLIFEIKNIVITHIKD